MANNDERLGASFGIDVTDLKAGLAQANRLIKESESEFKAAAAGMDNWSESQQGLEARIKHLNTAQDLQAKKVEALKKQYEDAGYASDDMSRAAVELRTKINKEQEALNKTEKELRAQVKALEDLENSSGDAAAAVEEVSKAAEESGEGFTIAKGAVAGFIANGLSALVGAVGSAISSLAGLAEETREYRQNIGKLQTAFAAAGKSAEEAAKVYNGFYEILGEEDQAVEAVNFLAKLVDNEKDLETWTNICAGVVGTFGNSLPIESLTEAANETAKVGQLTGGLADALNWAGVNEEEFQASLDKCNSEQERAQLITETLNGLYSEASELYKENNAEVINARKAAASYTDEMAALGAEMEPVNTAITEIKTEFVKGLTPAIKKDALPAVKGFIKEIKKSGTVEKFSKSVASLAKTVLPPVSKAVKFVAENFETLVKVTGAAVVAMTAFSSVMKISTAINAATTAVGALSAGVGIATKAQVGWNAAMTANPIGAVLTVVGLLAGAIALLVAKQDEAAASTDVLSESQRAAVTAAEEAAAAYRDTKTAADELAGAQMANVYYVATNLLPQLQQLIDKNGEVKAGEEGRAQFILGELNEALGTEYQSLSDIVDANGRIKDSIFEVIEAKKAQILLEAYEETYRQAVQNVAAAEQARATQAQEIAATEEELAAKRRALREAEAAAESAIDGRTINMYEQRASRLRGEVETVETTLAEQQAAYSENESALNNYYKNIADYEKASVLVAENKTTEAVDYLLEMGNGFKTAASTAKLGADEQKKVLEQQVIDTEVNARLMKENYEKGVEGVTEEMVKTAEEQAKKAKEEFYKVGGDITKGIANGANDAGYVLSNSMAILINKALNAARQAAEIKSPSRKFKKIIGKNIGLGVAAGIDETAQNVVTSMRGMINAAENTADMQAISGKLSARPANSTQTTAGNDFASMGGTKEVNIYQTNNYSQEHSRRELYKTKQQTVAAVKLAMGGAY